jgi:hypothetical protein
MVKLCKKLPWDALDCYRSHAGWWGLGNALQRSKVEVAPPPGELEKEQVQEFEGQDGGGPAGKALRHNQEVDNQEEGTV